MNRHYFDHSKSLSDRRGKGERRKGRKEKFDLALVKQIALSLTLDFVNVIHFQLRQLANYFLGDVE